MHDKCTLYYSCVDITNPPPLGNHCACGFYMWLIVCGITSKSAVKSVYKILLTHIIIAPVKNARKNKDGLFFLPLEPSRSFKKVACDEF